MVSSFYSQTSDGSTLGASTVTNPIEAAKKEKDAKIAKAVSEQEARAKSLFTRLQEQRKVYAEAKKEYYEAKADNLRCKHTLERREGLAFVRERNQERFDKSKVVLHDTRSARNTELSRLESYTDDYCSAQKIAMNLSIFAQ